jgi:hypothetical protein
MIRITCTIGEVTAANELLSRHPSYVISGIDPDPSSDYIWLASAALTPTTFIILESINVAPLNGITTYLGQVLYNPVGVAMQSKKPSEIYQDLTVLLSGVYQPTYQSALTVGRYYYTDSNGKVVLPLLPSETGVDVVSYVMLADRLISLDAQVGIAVSETEILLRMRTEARY